MSKPSPVVIQLANGTITPGVWIPFDQQSGKAVRS